MTFQEKLYQHSQEQLARELGVSRQAISRWELGEVVPDTAWRFVFFCVGGNRCGWRRLVEPQVVFPRQGFFHPAALGCAADGSRGVQMRNV